LPFKCNLHRYTVEEMALEWAFEEMGGVDTLVGAVQLYTLYPAHS
jgi:hypothetical protein